MKRNYNKKQGGYVMLVGVLVAGSVGLAIAVTLLILGLGFSRSSFALEQSYQAKALADLCAEEALQLIRDNSAFTGSGSLTAGSGTCSYAVLNLGPAPIFPLPPPPGSGKIIRTSGVVADIARYVEVVVDGINPKINIVSWKEVPFVRGL